MKAKTKKDRAMRRDTVQIEVSNISSSENLAKIAKFGYIVEASTTGLLLQVKREDLIPKSLKNSLNIDALIGDGVMLHLPQMNLEISGTVARTKLVGKQGYEIAIDYTADAPEYWRECLFDLLPGPGEIEEQ